MRKPKMVTIPEDRPLSVEELQELWDHAKASSSWYCSTYARSTAQVLEKLRKKSYRDGEVTYLTEGGVLKSFDIFRELEAWLQEMLLVDDDAYAQRLAERLRERGLGPRAIEQKLREKGLTMPPMVTPEAQLLEGLERQAQSYMGRSTYYNESNDFKKEQKLTRYLFSKGYSLEEIQLWRDSHG